MTLLVVMPSRSTCTCTVTALPTAVRIVRALFHLLLQIIAQRVASYTSQPVRSAHAWNTYPGALVSRPAYSPCLSDYPFYVTLPEYVLTARTSTLPAATRDWIAAQLVNLTRTQQLYAAHGSAYGHAPDDVGASMQAPMTSHAWQYALYTALIYARTTPTHPNTALYRLIKSLSKSSYLYQVSRRRRHTL